MDKFIKDQYKELPELSDDALIAHYLSNSCVKRKLKEIHNVLVEHGLTHSVSATLAKKLISIPPGLKSHIRGRRFNEITACEIRKSLRALKLSGEVQFETEKCHSLFHEIPDWTLRKGNKTLVGYNQISLFGGGHQLNRGSKYILDDTLHAKLSKRRVKMVCVVKDIPVRSNKGKTHAIFMKGIERKRIYCIGGLKKLIKEFFVD